MMGVFAGSHMLVNNRKIYKLELAIILTIFLIACTMMFVIAPRYLENPGVLFARQAFSISKELENLAEAENIANWISGGPEYLRMIRAEYGLIQALLLLPTSIVFSFFGASENTILVWSMLLYLFSILMVYRLASLLSGTNAVGLIAAYFWAFLPSSILFASSFLLTSTYLLISLIALYQISVFFSGGKDRKHLIVAIMAMAFLIATYPKFGVSFALFWILSIIATRLVEKITWISIGEFVAVSFVAINLLIPKISQATLQLISDLFTLPAILPFIFLSFLGFIFVLRIVPQKGGRYGKMLSFAYSIYLAVQILPATNGFLFDNSKGLAMSLLLFALVMPISEMLELKSSKGSRLLTMALGGIGLILVAVNVDLSFSLSQDVFYGDQLLSISRIAEGILLSSFFGLAYFLMVDKKAILSMTIGLLFLLFPLGMLFPLASSNYVEASFGAGYRRAIHVSQAVVNQDESIPIYVCSKRLRDRFWFLSGFNGIDEKPKNREVNPFLKFDRNAENIDWGIAIIDAACDEFDTMLIERWQELVVYGEGEFQVAVYRIFGNK